MIKNDLNIPLVKPIDFDKYLFENWKAPTYNLYENFHIEKIENYKDHLTLPTLPHRRSVNIVFFLTKGIVTRSKGLNKYELKENSCFCLAADQITGIDYMSEDAAGFYIHFLPEIFKSQYLNIEISRDIPIFSHLMEPHFEISNPDKVVKLFNQLLVENQANNQTLIPLYLTILLFEIQSNSLIRETDRKDASTILTLKYKNALLEHTYNFKTVSEFAIHLSVTPNHLLKCVKNTTGKSARELLEEMRILEAKVLLKQTNLSVAEIGFKIGKYEASDFARFFKSKTKNTPLQYRNL